jgi:hypothetical protein
MGCVFWRDTVMKVPKAGGAATSLVPQSCTLGALAVFGDTVFWVGDKELRAVPAGGGPATTLATDVVTVVAADARAVYFGRHAGNAWMILRAQR